MSFACQTSRRWRTLGNRKHGVGGHCTERSHRRGPRILCRLPSNACRIGRSRDGLFVVRGVRATLPGISPGRGTWDSAWTLGSCSNSHRLQNSTSRQAGGQAEEASQYRSKYGGRLRNHRFRSTSPSPPTGVRWSAFRAAYSGLRPEAGDPLPRRSPNWPST